MAVVVFDRENRQWPFANATTATVDVDTGALLLRDIGTKVVGAFNGAAWTHWGITKAAV